MTNVKLFSISLILSSILISGCAPVLVGGAAITSATVMTDRRSTGSIVDDEVLEKCVRYEIGEVIGHDKHHIAVTSYEGKILLTGEVLTSQDKNRAQEIATQSVGVNAVINELAVMDPSSVTTLLSDSMLATKVRSAIISTEHISLNQMKVTVQRGIVYLMGIVTPEEAKLASTVAAKVNGVQQVVTCFNVETKSAIDNRLKNLSKN